MSQPLSLAGASAGSWTHNLCGVTVEGAMKKWRLKLSFPTEHVLCHVSKYALAITILFLFICVRISFAISQEAYFHQESMSNGSVSQTKEMKRRKSLLDRGKEIILTRLAMLLKIANIHLGKY